MGFTSPFLAFPAVPVPASARFFNTLEKGRVDSATTHDDGAEAPLPRGLEDRLADAEQRRVGPGFDLPAGIVDGLTRRGRTVDGYQNLFLHAESPPRLRFWLYFRARLC